MNAPDFTEMLNRSLEKTFNLLASANNFPKGMIVGFSKHAPEEVGECPQCGNKDKGKLTVVRRTCGYLGENFWNTGKTKEIPNQPGVQILNSYSK